VEIPARADVIAPVGGEPSVHLIPGKPHPASSTTAPMRSEIGVKMRLISEPSGAHLMDKETELCLAQNRAR